MLLEIIIVEVLCLVSGLVGYYIGHRGLTGVQSDLNDVKQDIANVKGKLEGTPSVVATVS